MPDMWEDVDVALVIPVNILALTDDTDFKSRETGIVYNQAGMDLVWNFFEPGATVPVQTAVTPTTAGDYDWAHLGDGMYTIEIPASAGASINNNVEGFGYFTGICTGVLHWRGPTIGFRATGLNNALVQSAYSTTRGLAGTALPDAVADAAGGLPISDAGGLDLDALFAASILQSTTIATLASQVSFTLTAGSADNDAYNGATIVIVDASTGVQKAFGSISDYVGVTKTVTLAQDPGIFTMAATDKVYILPSDVFAVWDRLLTGATHNINNSAGKRLRDQTALVMSSGTAQAGGANTITLAAGESATDDLFWQSYVAIVGGTGAGQGHHIISYNGTTKVAVMDDDWVVTPDATSEYVIYGSGSHDEMMSGLAQAGAASTITLEATASAVDDLIVDDLIVVVSGTGAHQTRRVTAYNGTTKVATVDSAWITNPDATSGYWIIPQGHPNVWDELLSGSTHNISTSSGRRLREISAIPTLTGTVNDATATTTVMETTLTGYGDSFFSDALLLVELSADNWQARPVTSYSSLTGEFTLDEALTSAPANGVNIAVQITHIHPVSEIEANILARLPAALVSGRIDANVSAINDSNAAAIIQALALIGLVSSAAATGTLSVTEMTTTLTEVTPDHYNGRIIVWTSGVLNGQATNITDYDGATKKLTFTQVTEAPSDGDTFIIF